jgi:uncharacterized protein with NAD-binding domain and iron-sulfur cluster
MAPRPVTQGRWTRRRFLRNAAGAAAAVPLATAGPASARRRRRPTVAVLGGGVAGLTAAHELIERGFDVTVYERRAFGGKARSFGVRGTGSRGRVPLPAEHGARFFAGFYQNVPDTMRRIPFRSNRHGVFDNLIPAPSARYSRVGRADFNLEYAPDTRPWTLDAFREALTGWIELTTYLPPQETAYFVERLIVFFSSCDARRFGEWEHMSWWKFVAADRFSEEYRRVLVNSVTRFLLAARPRESGARTMGRLWEAGLYNQMGRGSNGPFDRILNGPTNEAWIDPWVAQLRRLGVRFRLGCEVKRLHLRRGRIAAAEVATRRGRHSVEADWYVCAVPVERARQLFSKEILAADPRLKRLNRLVTRWQNGLQFYLREETDISHGHVLYEDSPWALASISQAQFWGGSAAFARRYGNGVARDCLSVDISDFSVPGILYHRPAWSLTPRQIAHECWAQMKASLNDTGHRELRDELLVTWTIDPGLVFRARGRGIERNSDPLLISTAGAWDNRPTAATAVPNLVLAADYVRVSIDTATMEGANHAARLAANAILSAVGSHADHARTYDLYDPPEWEPFRTADAELYARGRPNAFDTGPPPFR